MKGWILFIRVSALAGMLCFPYVALAQDAAKAHATSTHFQDLTERHWAWPYVATMSGRQVVHGYPDGTFRPDQSVTRQEALVMLCRALGAKDRTPTGPFPDGASIAPWARPCANWAAGHRWVPAREPLAPAAPASREWVVAALVNALEFADLTVPGEAGGPGDGFRDLAALPSQSRGRIGLATTLGLVRGYPDGSFRPSRSVTRAEMARLIATAWGFLGLRDGR